MLEHEKPLPHQKWRTSKGKQVFLIAGESSSDVQPSVMTLGPPDGIWDLNGRPYCGLGGLTDKHYGSLTKRIF